MGSGAVMHRELFVDFDAILIICFFTELPSLLSSFLIVSFLLIYFFTYLLLDVIYFF